MKTNEFIFPSLVLPLHALELLRLKQGGNNVDGVTFWAGLEVGREVRGGKGGLCVFFFF